MTGKGTRMSNSSLVTTTGYADKGNYTKGRSQKLRGIVIHHAVATTAQSVINTFKKVGRNGSAHYCVQDNIVALMVDESDTAWHCSNWNGNCRTIGIEVCNSTLAPDYKISDESWKTLVKLVADIAKRNGFGKLEYLPDGDGTGITGHKDWKGASTACPGPYLYPKLAQLAKEANDINYPPEPTLKWVEEYHDAMVAKTDIKLVKVKTGETVKTYKAGEMFTFTQRADYNGKTYYRTYYSQVNGIDNGFDASLLEEYVPAPEPEPEPEPTPEPKPKNIWQAIIEFIISIFTRRSK